MTRSLGLVVLTGVVALFASGTLWGSEADELRQKAAILQKQAADLASNGHEKEAEQLVREAEKLRDAAQRLDKETARAAGIKTGKHSTAEAGQLKGRIQQLIEMEQKLRNSKDHEEELAKVRHAMAEAERELALLHARQGGGKPPTGKGSHEPKLDEATRRIHHMRVAAENLRLAELPDVAQQILEKADAMEKELHEARQRHAAEQKAAHSPHEGPLHDVVSELRDEVVRLRAEVRELSKKVEQR